MLPTFIPLQLSTIISPFNVARLMRDIDDATSFVINPRNLEQPWEAVYRNALEAVVGEHESIIIRNQYAMWRYKTEASNAVFSLPMDESLRGKQNMIKELITDIALLLRVFMGSERYPALVAILFLELKRALPRKYIMYTNPSGSMVQDYFQTPSSLKGASALTSLLLKAIGQVEAQCLLQYHVQHAQNASHLIIVIQEMFLVAASGLWFMVAYAQDFEAAWGRYKTRHRSKSDSVALVKLGTEEAMRVFKSNPSGPGAGAEDVDVDEDGTVPAVQPAPAAFKFNRDEHVVKIVKLHKPVFEWQHNLYNLREKEGWSVWKEIKQMVLEKTATVLWECDEMAMDLS
jgi:hypothetical protein